MAPLGAAPFCICAGAHAAASCLSSFSLLVTLPWLAILLPTFHPLLKDIRYHIAHASVQASPIDQIDTEKKVQLWRSSDKPPPVRRFRPYNPEANSTTPDDDDFHDEVADNDPAVPLASRLLFVHQEQWQKDLLAMYGDVCLLDATHRCTKYDIPLFFLVIATNVGYTVVAEFCTQSERAEDIAEALGLLKDYNPLWKPSHFMTDYSEAELLAIEQISPNVRSYLCDFHREQAWLRWCKDKKHGLEDDTAAILLDHLRKLAYAPTCREGNEAFDKYYREAEAKLQQLPLWQQNRNVRGWFTAKWLSCPERWARAFTSQKYQRNIFTNNGVEAQNKTLKYSFLPRGKVSLTSLLAILVEEFVPEQKKKYLIPTVSQGSGFRKYNDFVPHFLHNRPHTVIKHCLARRLQARSFNPDDITINDEGVFHVKSSDQDGHYVVDYGTPKCTCSDYLKYGIPCKHFLAVFRHIDRWGWNALPAAYRSSPVLTLNCATIIGNEQEPALLALDEDNVNASNGPLPNIAVHKTSHQDIQQKCRQLQRTL